MAPTVGPVPAVVDAVVASPDAIVVVVGDAVVTPAPAATTEIAVVAEVPATDIIQASDVIQTSEVLSVTDLGGVLPDQATIGQSDFGFGTWAGAILFVIVATLAVFAAIKKVRK